MGSIISRIMNHESDNNDNDDDDEEFFSLEKENFLEWKISPVNFQCSNIRGVDCGMQRIGNFIKLELEIVPSEDKLKTKCIIANCADFSVTVSKIKVVDRRSKTSQLHPKKLKIKPNAKISFSIGIFNWDFNGGTLNLSAIADYNSKHQRKDRYDSLVKDMEKMLMNNSGAATADWTLTSYDDDQKIGCHKLILSARSKVFHRMITQTGFIETSKNETLISDMNFATLKSFVTFIYTNKISKNSDLADLFLAADKYEIPDLLQQCEVLMMESMSIENAATFYHCSILFQAEALKKFGMIFIVKNFDSVKVTDGWTTLKQDTRAAEHLSEIATFVCATPIQSNVPSNDLITPKKEEIDQFRGLAQDLKRALQDPTFVDCRLSCQGKTISCHSLILTSRSRVFANMLTVDGQKKSSHVIQDVKFGSLKAVVLFLYTNEVKIDKSGIVDLFAAAKQFKIDELCQRCENMMLQNLSIETAIGYFKFASLSHEESVKKVTMKFIESNFEKIKATSDWDELKRDPLATQPLEDLIAYICSQKVIR